MSTVVPMEPIASIDQLFAVLEAGANRLERDDGPTESVDLLAHALQCATVLRHTHPDDIEVQIAGLVHDIGHLLVPGAADAHGVVASSAMVDLLGARVARLVELHVPAKRFLVTTAPDYAGDLSPTSVHTLALQGGSMSAAEVEAFGADPLAQDALALRRADDAAKVPGLSTPGLTSWRAVVEQHVADSGRA